MNGNGHPGRIFETDRNKVSLLTTAITAAMWFQEDRTNDKAYDVLVRSIEDCLGELLGREPTEDEVEQVLRHEV